VNITIYVQHSQETTIYSGWEWLPEVDGEVEHTWWFQQLSR